LTLPQKKPAKGLIIMSTSAVATPRVIMALRASAFLFVTLSPSFPPQRHRNHKGQLNCFSGFIRFFPPPRSPLIEIPSIFLCKYFMAQTTNESIEMR
jgi:hypothetical protein